jgi:hypothetical protein
MEILSDCCGAILFPVEADICTKCYKPCEAIEIKEDMNGNKVKFKL